MRFFVLACFIFHLIVFQHEMEDQPFKFKPPVIKHDTPMDVQFIQDHPSNDVFKSHIDVHFNFSTDEWEKTDHVWKRVLEKTWFESWPESIQKTVGYAKADPEVQKRLVERAETIQSRIENLKDKIRVIIHTDPDLPSLSYCVLPRDYKCSVFSEWVKIERETMPNQFFFIDFFEYLWSKETIQSETEKYYDEMVDRDWQMFYVERNRVSYYAIQWAKTQRDVVDFKWVNMYDDTVTFESVTPAYTAKQFQLTFKDLGFEPKPAVAWSRPPEVKENPMNYGLMRK